MYWQIAILGFIFINYVFFKVKKRLFSEMRSFLWILGGLGIIMLSLYPGLITGLARLLSIEYPPAVVFLLSIVFIMFVIFRLEQDVSVLNEKLKELTQKNAIMDEKIYRLERTSVKELHS